MTTAWKSDANKNDKKYVNPTTDKTNFRTTLSTWSRQQKLVEQKLAQQKLAMIAGFGILGLLLVASACSKHSPKSALVGVSSPASTAPVPTPTAVPTSIVPGDIAAPAARKKAAKKRPANVEYSDSNFGVSFLYPRKFALTSGDKAQPSPAAMDAVTMNFVQPGGVTVATVATPSGLYPGTDFESAFFNVNVNRNLSEQECGHFAFVDTRNADGEPVDAEEVKVGSTQMKTTSTFSANVQNQMETQYYHSYVNGTCYEYVLGMGTEGFVTEGGIEHVDSDKVFARLEKILATVKINPPDPDHVAERTGGILAGKE